MKNILFLSLICLLGFLGSCKKSEKLIKDESITPPVTPPATDTIKFINAKPTSVSTGMKNYQSYFLAKTDNKVHGFLISTPLDYDASNPKKYPLLVFIHGDWEKPENALYDHEKLKLYGPHKEIYYRQRAFPAIVASIQMSESDVFVNPKVVKEFIDVLMGKIDFQKTTDEATGYGRYYIDSNKVHLTGLSWGGNGVYKTATSYPGFFASLSVLGGFPETEEKMALIKEPTYIRHNLNDNMVIVFKAYQARDWINAGEPKTPVNIEIFDAYGHDCWSREYSRTDSTSVYEWHWSKNK